MIDYLIILIIIILIISVILSIIKLTQKDFFSDTNQFKLYNYTNSVLNINKKHGILNILNPKQSTTISKEAVDGVTITNDKNMSATLIKYNSGDSIKIREGNNSLLVLNYSGLNNGTNTYKITSKIIPNDWNSGMNNNSNFFWAIDYGSDIIDINNVRWKTVNDTLRISNKSTKQSSGNINRGFRAFPVNLLNNGTIVNYEGGNLDSLPYGVAFDGLWQMDINISSKKSGSTFTETFYLAERQNMFPNPDNYMDGSKKNWMKKQETRGGSEIDIFEALTKIWKETSSGFSINIPYPQFDDDEKVLAHVWNTEYFRHEIKNDEGKTEYKYKAKPLGKYGELNKENGYDIFITVGCLIRGDNLWFFAYKPNGQLFYATDVIKKSSKYVRRYPFVPYISIWEADNTDYSNAYGTSYTNFVYLKQDDELIRNFNPKDNPDKFGKILTKVPTLTTVAQLNPPIFNEYQWYFQFKLKFEPKGKIPNIKYIIRNLFYDNDKLNFGKTDTTLNETTQYIIPPNVINNNGLFQNGKFILDVIDSDTNTKYGTLELILEDISKHITDKIFTYKLKTDDYIKFNKNPSVSSNFKFLLICEHPDSQDKLCEYEDKHKESLLQYYTLLLQNY